jgi:LytR cell envelope-related transcriptional attenuator
MSSTRPPSYDERFVVPVEASRRGAHRARVSPAFAFLPYVAIAAVVLVVGALAWTLVGSSLFGNSPSSGLAAGGGASTSAATGTRPAVSTSPATTPSSTPATSTSTSPSTSVSPTSSLPAGVDVTVAITVLNGSNPARSGLAARATTRLLAAGWTGTVVSKRSATSAGTTIVYYGQTDLKKAALAVVASLGVGRARFSPARAGTAIEVIMSNDYTG